VPAVAGIGSEVPSEEAERDILTAELDEVVAALIVGQEDRDQAFADLPWLQDTFLGVPYLEEEEP